MELGNFITKNLGEDLLEDKKFCNMVKDFINELSNYLKNNESNKDSNMDNNKNNKLDEKIQEHYDRCERIRTTTLLKENKTYVISDIYDNRLQVVDIENGDEIEIYVLTGDENLDKFNDMKLCNRVYTMNRLEFLNLNLTDNVVLKNGMLNANTDEVKIKNDFAWKLLSDLYESRITDNGKMYEIKDIKENKLYLTNADGSGGYFSIYQELYPDFKVGDIVQRNNRKYDKVKEGK